MPFVDGHCRHTLNPLRENVVALSVVDLYAKVLPRTNCGDCGYPTCLAFAGRVVSQKLPLAGCPHLSAEVIARCQPELDAQHAAGKWTQRDMAADALNWARERAASMDLADLPARIGGSVAEHNGAPVFVLPYFDGEVRIGPDGIHDTTGNAPGRWEQVFIYNHLAQGGSRLPTGRWKALQEIPNTVSKIKSMRSQVEAPLRERFSGRRDALAAAALAVGGRDVSAQAASADLAFCFQVFPRVPVMLLFWDADEDAGFEAEIKLAFDETIIEHLDIESILFMSENLAGRLIDSNT
jgi:hypothetical protein